MMMRAWLWLRSILFRSRLEREMQEEMSSHLRRTVERFEAEGMSAAAARAAASREFGNVAAIKEEARDARGGRGIESVLADLRYGIRCLSRTPFSAAAMIAVGRRRVDRNLDSRATRCVDRSAGSVAGGMRARP